MLRTQCREISMLEGKSERLTPLLHIIVMLFPDSTTTSYFSTITNYLHGVEVGHIILVSLSSSTGK